MIVIQNIKIIGLDESGKSFREVVGQVTTEQALEINRDPLAFLLPEIPFKDRRLVKRAILLISEPTIVDDEVDKKRKQNAKAWRTTYTIPTNRLYKLPAHEPQ